MRGDEKVELSFEGGRKQRRLQQQQVCGGVCADRPKHLKLQCYWAGQAVSCGMSALVMKGRRAAREKECPQGGPKIESVKHVSMYGRPAWLWSKASEAFALLDWCWS